MSGAPARLGPDVLLSGDVWHAYLDGHLVAANCATSKAAWAAARTAATQPTPMNDPAFVGDMIRARVDRTDLGGGLSRDTIKYTYQGEDTESIETYGISVAYALQLAHGELAFEVDTNMDFRRCVGMIEPGGTGDHHFTAAEWLRIANLLRRDEVYAALDQWAAEDAAANAMDG